jgi:hypothetical protein
MYEKIYNKKLNLTYIAPSHLAGLINDNQTVVNSDAK